MSTPLPDWLNPSPWVTQARAAGANEASRVLDSGATDTAAFARLIAPAAAGELESMAQRARRLTRHHFGNTISLYAPLYLSNYCSGGCAYCGFAADRDQPRYRLEPGRIDAELAALASMGVDDVLLLTGERCPRADAPYLRDAVARGAAQIDFVGIEAFAMTAREYADMVAAGCAGVTLYQETYDPDRYAELHRWGPKRDYVARLAAPDAALAAGMRSVGIGALLGLSDPLFDAVAVYQHARHLQRTHWRSGVSISFPRICGQRGDFTPLAHVTERMLAQFIFAFRICLPDVPLVLSTRERPAFRDGLAGVGISRMSAASRTTVGGYAPEERETGGQFDINDTRDMATVCRALRDRGLEPVFKNWDRIFQATAAP